MPTKDLTELTSGFLYTYLIMFTPQMFLESLWSCALPPIVVSYLQWGVNFIKYVQRNPEVSWIKSFVGIQLQRNWLNACNLRFASNMRLYVANPTVCGQEQRRFDISTIQLRDIHFQKTRFFIPTPLSLANWILFSVSCLRKPKKDKPGNSRSVWTLKHNRQHLLSLLSSLKHN